MYVCYNATYNFLEFFCFSQILGKVSKFMSLGFIKSQYGKLHKEIKRRQDAVGRFFNSIKRTIKKYQ